MIYQVYRAQAEFLDLVRPLAAATGTTLRLPWPLLRPGWPLRMLAGALETFANLTLIHARLPFGIESVPVGNRLVPVTEEAVYSTPFATLLHFKKATEAPQPRVLVVAPMSGHFATLLRATVKTIRDVPLAEGCFDFSAFVDHLVEFLQVMGAGSHVVAVCQPCVPVSLPPR
jgi:polyhydroxyalkanoate depolymerase